MSHRLPQVWREFKEPATNPAWWPRCETCGKPMKKANQQGQPKPDRPPPPRRPAPQIPHQLSMDDAL